MIMANNSSNSNYVNISNLPQTQEAVSSDLLILQTENGTQTITFDNLNVVKTDAVGNATIVGGVTGNQAQFSTLSSTNYVTSPLYYSNNTAGYTGLNGFYNRFTLNGGLVTSATYIARADDDYNYITQTFVPGTTAWQNGIYTRTIDRVGQAGANPNSDSVNITIGSFFNDFPFISVSQVKPYHISISVNGPLSCFPYVNNIQNDGANGLLFTVNFPTRNVPNLTVNGRVLITYVISAGQYFFPSNIII